MRFALISALLCAAAASVFAQPGSLHLLQKPALSKDLIVFSYASDLWSVPRAGGVARRLTTGQGFETDASFSPDGGTIAFSGEYDGNTDVFTMPAAGGVPKRITFHPGIDRAVGWTPDGKHILFRSARQAWGPRYTQLFTVAAEGGFASALPLPIACTGSYSPDGQRLVYAPLDGGQFAPGFTNYVAWKRYRGGEASYLWIVNLADLSIVKIPRTDSNDINPMWIGNKIYFLSDRDGPMTLFEYDTQSKQVKKLIRNDGPGTVHDILSAGAGPGAIVYEQFGEIHLYDIASGKEQVVPVDIAADLTEVRPHFQNVASQISNARISPTGARAVFEAHGEIFTAPAEKGDLRNLTRTPGVMERTPSWSPDGLSVAYFSDESGEYALHVKAQSGEGETRKFPLAGKSAYYFNPKWSPDGKRIAFNDNQLNIWEMEIASGKLTHVDTEYDWNQQRDFSWSGDSKWIAFSREMPNLLSAIFIYSLDEGKTHQITDGMSDAVYPAFDRDGKYLYFTASTNYGPTISGLDMTSDEHQVTRSVYLVVLPNDIPSPLTPESDEEKAPGEASPDSTEGAGKSGKGAAGATGDAGGKTPESSTPPKLVRIDFDKIAQRIVALPLPARNYNSLTTGRAGIVFLTEAAADGSGRSVVRFDMKTRKSETLASGVASFDLSANGDKMLLRIDAPAGQTGAAPAPPAAPQFVIASSSAPIKPGEGKLKLDEVEALSDPIAEWKQMYHEVWRIERSYFYDPNLHGLNVADQEKAYEKYLDSLSSRADLNYLFRDMLSEMTVGHLRGGGGNIPAARSVPGGLLGADYEIAGNRYRIKRIYSGENWNPDLQGPLAAPGLNVSVGDYLLSVNGRDLTAKDDVSALLEYTAGKRATLRVGPDPAVAGSREIAVIPVASETQFRNQAWVEDNRGLVDKLSGGKLAYVYMPDTGQAGLRSFTRYYFAQTDKQGLVLDERFNSGGQVADYVIEVLNRQLLGWWSPRYGAIHRSPGAAILGPKVMVINELAGSGGDAMPWMFRATKTGTLVGKRTWGGLVGIGAYPSLMDGGTVTAPDFAFFNPNNQWDVENKGVAPDVEVELDPKSVAEGYDPQLERAVAIALQQLKEHPVPEPARPAYPNYQQSSRPLAVTPSGTAH
jgi:tricorn protease